MPSSASRSKRRNPAVQAPSGETGEGDKEPSGLQREVLQELKDLFLKGTVPVEAKRRDNIVMTRIWDSDLRIVDALIMLDIFKSRSEAVAFLVHEGIQSKRALVETILPAIERIEEIKRRTREKAVKALHETSRHSHGSSKSKK